MVEFIQVALVCYVVWAVLVAPLRHPAPARVRSERTEGGGRP